MLNKAIILEMILGYLLYFKINENIFYPRPKNYQIHHFLGSFLEL